MAAAIPHIQLTVRFLKRVYVCLCDFERLKIVTNSCTNESTKGNDIVRVKHEVNQGHTDCKMIVFSTSNGF